MKLKGCFEIDPELHKDPSMRIVPMALKDYFVNGIPVEETVTKHTDILDFCMRMKTNSQCQGLYRYLNKNGRIVEDKLQRTTRYYVSNGGGILLKDFSAVSKGQNIQGVNVGFNATLFNKVVNKPFEEYDINYRFYIKECYKIINVIEESAHNPDLFDDNDF